MRKIITSDTFDIDGVVLPINTWGEGKGCYVEMLTAIHREMTAMLSHHRKVLMFRVDVRIYEYTNNNKVISMFMRRFKRWAMQHYDTKHIGHIWCREVETAKKQHYHLFIMMDGSKVLNSKVSSDKCLEIAERNGLSVWLPDKPNYKVNRGDTPAFADAFKRASYLAKQRGKKLKGKRANSFSASRIEPRLNEHGQIFTAGDDYSKRMIIKSTSQQITSIPDAIKASLPPTDNIIKKQLTDAERQLSLF
jgi:hypothetical protein